MLCHFLILAKESYQTHSLIAILNETLIPPFLTDPVSLVRDHFIKQKLVEAGVSVQSYNADLLFEPWEVYDKNGHAFTTFESYWDKCLHMQMEPVSHLPPWRLVPASGIILMSSKAFFFLCMILSSLSLC